MRVVSKRKWTMFVVVVVLALLLLPAIPPVPTQAQTAERCFAETGLCVSGRLRQYWEQNGGLPVFGLPITPQREETIAGWTGQVQWFERNRLELHPENPRPYDVLLGRLGAEFVARGGSTPARAEPRDGCRYFDQTGHNVCGDFLAYWSASGLDLGEPGTSAAESLALFGFPLTGEFETTLEDGTTATVQWFERARFERHPNNQPPYNVLLARLGVAEVGQPSGPVATATALTLEFIGNRSGDGEAGLAVTIVDAAGSERTATTDDDGRVTFASLPGQQATLTRVLRGNQAFTFRILPSQNVANLVFPLTEAQTKTIRLIISIDPPIVLADADDVIQAPAGGNPPAADDNAAIEAAVRAHFANANYLLREVRIACIIDGTYTSVNAIFEEVDSLALLLRKEAGSWVVVKVYPPPGPALLADPEGEMTRIGFPRDFIARCYN